MTDDRDINDVVQEAEATFEELAQLELDFEDIETMMLAKQYLASLQLYERRAQVIRKIGNFWPLAFEMAPPEIDAMIQPSDSDVITGCLQDFHVDRFEVPRDVDPTSADVAAYGVPRSLHFRFEFAENEWFEDRVVEKKFYWRRAEDGFVGLISDPVKIRWKPGKDLTHGLLDAACGLAEAWRARPAGAKLQDLREAAELEKMVDATTEGSQSFFAWFGYIGRFITPEEDAAARAAFEAKRRAPAGSESRVGLADMALEGSVNANEIFPGGEALATDLADQFWPGALSYFTNAQEDLSEADFEDDDDIEGMDGVEEDDEDEDEDDEDGDEAPPSKKQRT